MKKITIVLFVISAFVVNVVAQKKILDHSVYDDWQQISNLNISSKGNFTFFEIQPQEGDTRLVFKPKSSKKQLVVDRGYDAVVTPDEKYAVCLIKPFFKNIRQAKIKKTKPENMPKDSIAIITLKTGHIQKYPNVTSFQISKENPSFVAFLRNDTALIPKAERRKKELGKPLMVYNLSSQKTDTIHYVEQYSFDASGRNLVVVLKDTTKNINSSVAWIQLPGMQKVVVAPKRAFYSLPVFNEEADKLLFVASDDTLSSGSKKCELLMYQSGQKEAKTLIPVNNKINFPENWALNEYATPFFSRNGKTIFVGIAPVQEPKDTTLVPFETAALDVWNYADAQLPPMQLKRLKEDLKKTCLTVYDATESKLIPMTTSFFDNTQLLDQGNAPFVLSADETKSIVSTQWNTQNEIELSLVDVHSGKRTPIASGRFSLISASPEGHFVLWFNLTEGQWYVYDVAKQLTRNLTGQIPLKFWDEKNDIPQYADAYGMADWLKNDQAVLLYDYYDIWMFPMDGAKPVNLTQGLGRTNQIVFRYMNTKEKPGKNVSGQTQYKEKDFITPETSIVLSAFDDVSKKQGFASLKMNGTAKPRIDILDGYTFALLKKAKETNDYVYTKANFNTSPNVYQTSDDWKKEEKLSAINPQMKDYSWGTAELYKWNAYDGTALTGLLYKPGDFDPNKKYPVIVYFYERNSDKLYTYYPPAPSWSTINIPFYCSRGYVVFVPDIVYHTGVPGESAYNCIVSGAESLAKNTWIDKGNMAIQGQSWGGYQVAYLVTRTNMFKAAEAGAPVSNMTSAYGGIRWGTGLSRQFQYEHTQSRIGRTLWEAPDLYISNSPLFRADKVETPLLIMHNDADGSVPWYQGIEYFMALRRLGKQVWMLQYNNEDHNLVERRNRKDLSIRMQQFFDYYLKASPMPAWMKNGIPASRKGQYFGLENAE